MDVSACFLSDSPLFIPPFDPNAYEERTGYCLSPVNVFASLEPKRGWSGIRIGAAAVSESLDTLAVRRLKSNGRLRLKLQPTRRRSQSLDLSNTAQIGSGDPSSPSSGDRRRSLPSSPPTPQVILSNIEDAPIDILEPPIKPIHATVFKSTTIRVPNNCTPTSPATSTSSNASALFSPTYTSLATATSSRPPSPYLPLSCDHSPLLCAPSIRRTSEPLPSGSTTHSPTSTPTARHSSEQGSKAWFPIAASPTLSEAPPPREAGQFGLALASRTTSNASSNYSSRTATGTVATMNTTATSSFHRFATAAGVDLYTPALPSPLSTCHTPESLAAEEHPWPHSNSLQLSSGPRHGCEFPFPPSPSLVSLPLTQGSWSQSYSPRQGPPPSPLDDPRTRTTSSLSLPPLTHTTRQDRNRSRSGGASSSNIGLGGPPSASSHWRAISSASTFSQNSQCTSQSSSSLLTPPESTHLPTAADLAWNDLGLGRLGLMNSFSLPYSTTQYELGQKEPVIDLSSLEKNGQTFMPAHDRISSVGSTVPDDENKRMGYEGLMGGTSGDHFGPATRDMLAQVINDHLESVPIPAGDATIGIVEYGALHSRSASIISPIISHFVNRQSSLREEQGLPLSDDDSLSFQVTHTDKVLSDFRPLVQQLESHADSYLSQTWQASHRPSLDSKIFSSFAARPFGAKVVAKGSVSVGFSAMSLHWLSMDRKYQMSKATIAHGELMAFLSARATEFKPGGLFAMAFISRSEEDISSESSPKAVARAVHPGLAKTHSDGVTKSPTFAKPGLPGLAGSRGLARERSSSSPPALPVAPKRDIWSILSSILGKAIQRLVSTQLLKVDVARQLLALPIHPRTAKQTSAVLQSMQHSWEVETEERVVLPHPSWKGLQENTISTADYADHTIQLIKIFYESEMREILREALLSRATCEWILESLFDIAKEKVEEEGPQPLELEVQIVALRRKPDSAKA
ncbi:hypothetical protein P7C70_g3326, partial [Phenoliferia sp. Uapishka_3]